MQTPHSKFKAKLLTSKEAAEYLFGNDERVNIERIYRMTTVGDLPYTTLEGKRQRPVKYFTRENLDKWIERNTYVERSV